MTTSKTGLVRAIGRWSLVALTVNSVIGSGVFGLPGTVAALLGKQSILAVLLAGAAIGVIMMCFAEVASQFSEAGGTHFYARTGFWRLARLGFRGACFLSQTAAAAAEPAPFVLLPSGVLPQTAATRPL